jgi:hypothetical protein
MVASVTHRVKKGVEIMDPVNDKTTARVKWYRITTKINDNNRNQPRNYLKTRIILPFVGLSNMEAIFENVWNCCQGVIF